MIVQLARNYPGRQTVSYGAKAGSQNGWSGPPAGAIGQLPKLTVRARFRRPLHDKTHVGDILASLPTMTVRLVELTPKNVKAACDIQVKPAQQKVRRPSSRVTRRDLRASQHGMAEADP
jgi:hypothetical protein